MNDGSWRIPIHYRNKTIKSTWIHQVLEWGIWELCWNVAMLSGIPSRVHIKHPHCLVPKMWENLYIHHGFWRVFHVDSRHLGNFMFLRIASLIAAVCGTDKSCLLPRGSTTTRIVSVAQWPSFNSPYSFYSLTVAWMNADVAYLPCFSRVCEDEKGDHSKAKVA